jgi:hypothetical protein
MATMSDLNELFKALAQAKAEDPTNKRIKKIRGEVDASLNELKGDSEKQLVEAKQAEMIVEDMLTEVSPIPAQPVIRTPEQRIKDTNDGVSKYLSGKTFQQPKPEVTDKNVEAIQTKLKFLEQAIGRIAATGPGSGEVKLRYLDDLDRNSITDGLFLKYNGSTNKFQFANVNANALITNTTYVTTPEYTVQDDDYYIGVDYDGPTTIILPASDTNGRCLVIKDEDGDAQTNPITVQGTVDNDAGGFILQINNGSIQLIYRNGWRII